MFEEVDETIFIEGPRDVGHDHDLLPQPAAVRPPHVATTARHLLLNLEWRELPFKKTRDGVSGCGERSKKVPDALAETEARARLPEVERPLLSVKIKERLHQTVGSRETAVFTKDTPRDFIKSPEHVGPRPGPLPLPRGSLHQSNLCPTKGTQEMVT